MLHKKESIRQFVEAVTTVEELQAVKTIFSRIIKQGRYIVIKFRLFNIYIILLNKKKIVLTPVLIHELAHHYTYFSQKDATHSENFKQNYIYLYQKYVLGIENT